MSVYLNGLCFKKTPLTFLLLLGFSMPFLFALKSFAQVPLPQTHQTTPTQTPLQSQTVNAHSKQSPYQRLALLEQRIYHKNYSEQALLNRTQRLEHTLFTPNYQGKGTLVERLNQLEAQVALLWEEQKRQDMLPTLSFLENRFLGRTFADWPIEERLSQLEQFVFRQSPQEGNLQQRYLNLSQMIPLASKGLRLSFTPSGQTLTQEPAVAYAPATTPAYQPQAENTDRQKNSDSFTFAPVPAATSLPPQAPITAEGFHLLPSAVPLAQQASSYGSVSASTLQKARFETHTNERGLNTSSTISASFQFPVPQKLEHALGKAKDFFQTPSQPPSELSHAPSSLPARPNNAQLFSGTAGLQTPDLSAVSREPSQASSQGLRSLTPLAEGNAYLRWQQVPVSVWANQASLHQAVRLTQLLSAWQEAVPSTLALQPEEASIWILFQPLPENQLGFSPWQKAMSATGAPSPLLTEPRLFYDSAQQRYITRVVIYAYALAQPQQTDFENSRQGIRLLTQQFGHALGLWGFSDNPQELMFPQSEQERHAIPAALAGNTAEPTSAFKALSHTSDFGESGKATAHVLIHPSLQELATLKTLYQTDPKQTYKDMAQWDPATALKPRR